jgi:hypothetical protein
MVTSTKQNKEYKRTSNIQTFKVTCICNNNCSITCCVAKVYIHHLHSCLIGTQHGTNVSHILELVRQLLSRVCQNHYQSVRAQAILTSLGLEPVSGELRVRHVPLQVTSGGRSSAKVGGRIGEKGLVIYTVYTNKRLSPRHSGQGRPNRTT